MTRTVSFGSALASGAAGAIVQADVDLADVPTEAFVVRVPDTAEALLALAAEHRRLHPARVVGITGSCGKTSTKDMLAAVLGAGAADRGVARGATITRLACP